MKRLYFLGLLVMSFAAFSQVTSVTSDPGLGTTTLWNGVNSTQLNANSLVLNQIVNVKLRVFNFDPVTSIPPGSCKIQMGLGKNIIVDPSFNLDNAALNNYFTWTTTMGSSGQVLIIGTLVNSLPPNFADMAVFRLTCNKVVPVGTADPTISSNFLITNDNPAFTLSDRNTNNNSSDLTYHVSAASLPVTFTNVKVVKQECSFGVNWSIENQQDLHHYEVEASNEGTSYIKVGEAAAQNISTYHLVFPTNSQLTSPTLFVRIKSVDNDGKYQYSKVVAVSGICQQKTAWQLYIYPNPVAHNSFVTIATKQGNFNGRYKLTLLDYSGKVYQLNEVQLDNQNKFTYSFNNLPGHGKYLVSIYNKDGSESGLLEIEVQ